MEIHCFDDYASFFFAKGYYSWVYYGVGVVISNAAKWVPALNQIQPDIPAVTNAENEYSPITYK